MLCHAVRGCHGDRRGPWRDGGDSSSHGGQSQGEWSWDESVAEGLGGWYRSYCSSCVFVLVLMSAIDRGETYLPIPNSTSNLT